jgi:NADH-quinone oxidoreductase subunit H
MTIKELAIFLAKMLSLTVPLLIAVAFLTLVERKVLASQQLRVGPNNVGYLGLLQPIADAVKLLLKETVLPSPANRYLFILAPMLTFLLSIIAFVVIPISPNLVIADINLGVSYIFAVSSLRCLWSNHC